MVLLYDSECGFCRWCVAWAIRRDGERRITATPIQSPLGAELLADLSPSERLGSAHVVLEGRRSSGGAAAAEMLAALAQTRLIGTLGRRLPRTSERLYRLLAGRRGCFGRLVSRGASMRADALLGRVRVETSQELEQRRTRARAS
jgi:predicted DCC family thiol-disulfide oxidoreductase YuxK